MNAMVTTNQNDRTLRLASYNIRKAKGVDGRKDPARIVDILAELNASSSHDESLLQLVS